MKKELDIALQFLLWIESNKFFLYVFGIIKSYDKHYGFNLISENKEISIIIEYSNIIKKE